MNASMNENALAGKWKRVRGKLKEQWGKLSDSQLDQVNGQYDQLVGLLQETYGYTTDKAREELDKFIERVDWAAARRPAWWLERNDPMPYQTVTDLPNSVRDNLPEHAQEIYMEAYNNAWKQYSQPGKRQADASQEETASRVAWAAVKKKYEKNEETGKWQESSDP